MLQLIYKTQQAVKNLKKYLVELCDKNGKKELEKKRGG
jgi:hypothetical protein